MIELHKISKSYRAGARTLEVLRDVDLHIGAGEFVSIMGSSGSGKSTLLNILGLLDGYDSGVYKLAGRDVTALSEREAARFRNRTIGFVFQAFHLLEGKNALENVALPLYYRGVSWRRRRHLALEALDAVGLRDWATHRPSQLSGGQKQRVALARSLVGEPEVVLADEPTGALDSQTAEQIMDLLEGVHRRGVTVVVVTHEADVAERTSRTIRIRDGKVLDPR